MALKAPAEAGAELHARQPSVSPDLLPAVVLGEQVGGAPFEGYRIFTRRLAAALRSAGPTSVYTIGGDPADGMTRVPDWRPLFSPQLWLALRRDRPRSLFYVHAATIPALIRVRALGWITGARTIVVALEPAHRSGLSRQLCRLLWPDLLMTTTEDERREVARLGGRVRLFSTGVDTDRFRPPLPGEKLELRRKWGLPADALVALHVGHLQRQRNIQALATIAARPRTMAVALVSGLHADASHGLRRELERSRILVLDGYRSNVEELYRAADCYVFPVPSRLGAIAMPLSVLEALASGLPVVTTRFGALPERFAGVSGVAFVDGDAELLPTVERLVASRTSTRKAVEPYAWDSVIDRLLADAASVPGSQPALNWFPRLAEAVLWRRLWHLEDVVRQRLWSRDLGFDGRPIDETASIQAGERLVADPGLQSRAVSAKAALVGTSAESIEHSTFAAVARLYGLELDARPGSASAGLIAAALESHWPLVCVQVDGLQMAPSAVVLLNRYLRGGGTVLLAGRSPSSNQVTASIAKAVGCRLPALTPRTTTLPLRFSGNRPDFAGELAGASFNFAAPAVLLGGRGRTLASAGEGAAAVPVVEEFEVGAGRLLISGLGDALDGPLGEAYAGAAAPSVLPAMMAVRRAYGESAWHAPMPLANVTVDDPALRFGFLGLDFGQLLEEARQYNFHVTVATIPRELPLADPAVLRLLKDHPDRLSACYHGNDHSGYEFYFGGSGRVRFRRRSLASQRRSVEQAAARGRRFASEQDYALDRVMVFPHGLSAAATLPNLGKAGFLASSNWLDRYPLGSTPPADFDLGMRPADVAWGGFPLLWRRAIWDRGTLLDLFIGRPAIIFCHPPQLRGGVPAEFIEAVGTINKACGGRDAAWLSLEQLTRHAYLQRRLPDGAIEVLMTGNEVCLHNEGEGEVHFRVHRPHRPATSWLAVDGGSPVDADLVSLTLEAGGMRTVRLVYPGYTGLPMAHERCLALNRLAGP